MFRRKIKVEPEVQFPHDLKGLGYFINENDQLRQIDAPEEGFDYFAYGKYHGYIYTDKNGEGGPNERLNERRREALDECLRKIALTRLEGLGLKKLLLPLGTSAEQPHVPIMVSQNLQSRNKVLILAPDTHGGTLGVWCMRSMESGTGTLNGGSTVDTVKRALGCGYGVVLMNSAQLLWDHTTKTPMSYATWRAVKDAEIVIDTEKNSIPMNRTPEEHVDYVFGQVLDKMIPSHAEIDIMACGMVAYDVVMFLNGNWDTWKDRIFALVMAESSHCLSNITNFGLRQFLMQRARNYIVHENPRETVILDPRFGCATFSSSSTWLSMIIPDCLDLFINYLDNAHADPENCNPDIPIIVGDVPDQEEWSDAMKSADENSVLRVLEPDSIWEDPNEKPASET